MINQPEYSSDLPRKVLDALSRGERAEAIEHLQRERNLSREEARELVAAYILSRPGLNLRMKDIQPATRWRLMGWLILLQTIVVAIGYFLFFHGKW
jgi:hypothetical protein